MKNFIYLISALTMFLLFSCGGSGKTEEQLKEEIKNELKEEMNAENNTQKEQTETKSGTFKKEMYEYHLVEGAGLEYKGKIVHGEAWIDKNGENIMIFCSKKIENKKEMSRSYYLFAYHYANSGSGFKLVREVKDMFENCDLADHTYFQKDYIKVTDLDKDNYGEITFTYRTGCNGDPTPVTQKLIMLENGEKYAIRGTTLIDMSKDSGPKYGGETKVDPSFDKAPDEFLTFAKDIWKKAYIYFD